MNETRHYPEQESTVAAAGGEPHEAVTAFCQQCGRALTSTSKRQVGMGIFCEPCATLQTAPAPGWTAVSGATSVPYSSRSTGPRSHGPNPPLAGWLGLIPGVGAMYNGQYPKGVLHLIVFVVLVSLADNLNWVLWWLVWGWIFYQAFDAYHTAQARRDGRPLPDPFGWNEWTDRMGGGRAWPPPTHDHAVTRQDTSAFRESYARTAPPPPPHTPPAGPTSAEAATSESTYAESTTEAWHRASNPSVTSDFVRDYVSPPSFESATFDPARGEAFGYAVGPTSVPYTPTFTGATVPVPDPVPSSGPGKFPTAAAWLIGLGLLFLFGNLVPSWRLTDRWLVPLFLAGIALWTGTRRITLLSRSASVATGMATSAPTLSRAARALLGPSLLFTLAVLLTLQTAGVLYMRHSWPVLLIVWGALLVLERSRLPRAPGGQQVNPQTEKEQHP